jgi:RNA polymerase sporulation-specific sigma factor
MDMDLNSYLSPELKKIIRKKNLSSGEITSLVTKYAKVKNLAKKDLFKDLIFENMAKMIFKMSADALKQTGAGSEAFADFFQYGTIGFMEALERFKPSMKIKFSTYAFYWIKHYLTICNQELRVFRTPRDIYISNAKYHSVVNESKLTDLSVDVILKKRGITREQFEKYRSDSEIVGRRLISLQNTIGPDGSQKTVENILRIEDKQNALDKLENDDMHVYIRRVSKLMPRDESLAIEKIFYEGLSRKELAKVLGVTPRRAAAIEAKAVKRLHNNLTARE